MKEIDRTVNTLDDRGKANSYNLVFKVVYAIEAPDGSVIRKETLREFRRYDFDLGFESRDGFRCRPTIKPTSTAPGLSKK